MSHWTSEEDETLIDFVRLHEGLYNVKSKDFRNTKLKEKYWCEIGLILGKTDGDCCKRWCYVRDYYIRRKRKSGSSGETARRRSHLLSFVDDVSPPRKNSYVAEDSFSYSFISPLKHEDPGDGSDLMAKSENYQETGDATNEDHANQDSNDTSTTSREDNRGEMKRKHETSETAMRNPTLNELDETDLFFRSMAKIVKKLQRHEQAHLRMQIGLLVGNAELGYIAGDTGPVVNHFT